MTPIGVTTQNRGQGWAVWNWYFETESNSVLSNKLKSIQRTTAAPEGKMYGHQMTPGPLASAFPLHLGRIPVAINLPRPIGCDADRNETKHQRRVRCWKAEDHRQSRSSPWSFLEHDTRRTWHEIGTDPPTGWSGIDHGRRGGEGVVVNPFTGGNSFQILFRFASTVVKVCRHGLRGDETKN